MLTYPNIDPVAISIGPLSIHWYGLMYLVGFTIAYYLMLHRAKQANSGWTKDQVGDLIFYSAMGVVLGGRCGYVLFYNFDKFLSDPLWLFAVWEGGMSFHGGLLGVALAVFLFARRYKKSFYNVTDFGTPMVPIGLLTGRLGNFIGGELWGRTTDVPWAMVFPKGGPLARHPSQLYEMALEGFVLLAIMWLYSNKPRPTMAVSGVFLVGYGAFRFFVEFFREPDSHIGYDLLGSITRGQILCIPMILFGTAIIYLGYKRQANKA
jgi:phosphatidylglycerol:prolipoprotein diacylglycerol transferase